MNSTARSTACYLWDVALVTMVQAIKNNHVKGRGVSMCLYIDNEMPLLRGSNPVSDAVFIALYSHIASRCTMRTGNTRTVIESVSCCSGGNSGTT
ncbi:hypothetical protein F5Y03DRAFT_366402 [Xylaria venustula]|nr:hypothetical protein F5Y03DRAFT_366402 [Xylaria venustula]